ncbi:LuxR C-terminal-related transcriptional regulator [Billgrantia desiderata]|uniref:LuxR C-terminal-related transcriptional regulator n=1 Tax=Billgrantia desiderata TaxID=52021 RepID=UPI00089ED84D|nr:LuxR C-terminal-related transcriptional regulator [Halomonas desiderata]SEF82030.1 transcriptional regulator, LuxR family [Halomonas desiderata]
METGKGIVLLATEINPQTQLFVNYIYQELQHSLSIVSPKSSLEAARHVGEEGEACNVVLLDLDHLDEADLQAWQARYHNQPQWVLTAFNLRDEEHAAQLLSFMQLKGVFYRSDSLELICKGIQSLLDGDLWMTRALMARLIEFYRRQQFNCYRPVCGITQRELEIIGLLGSGASNTKIAEILFVSEHTVKSHLYNIFRKINVSNRMQAVNWARQNLGSPPPLSLQRYERTSPRH